MVATMEQKTERVGSLREHIKDVTCPICGKALPYPQIVDARKLDRYSILLRTYYGWCFDCNKGFEVIQFCPLDDLAQWVIHKYQPYTLGCLNKPMHCGWKLVNELPVTPVIVGDSDKR